MFGLPPIQVWKGLVASTTSAWVFLHLFLAFAPSLAGGPILFFPPISALLVANAATVSILDVHTSRERFFYANLGVGPWAVYGVAVVWLGFLESLLGAAVFLFGHGSGR
jgi:hypothetical protein